jgi:hypothetical protein
MEPGDADVKESLHAVAHDIGGDGSLFGHGNVAGARAQDGDVAGSLRQWAFLDGDAPGFLVMDGLFELSADGLRMEGSDTRDEDRLVLFGEFRGNPDDLSGSFSGAEDDFRKPFPQRAVCIHRREPELSQWRGLKCAKGMLERNFSGAELLEKLSGLVGSHAVEVAMAEQRWSRAKPEVLGSPEPG